MRSKRRYTDRAESGTAHCCSYASYHNALNVLVGNIMKFSKVPVGQQHKACGRMAHPALHNAQHESGARHDFRIRGLTTLCSTTGEGRPPIAANSAVPRGAPNTDCAQWAAWCQLLLVPGAMQTRRCTYALWQDHMGASYVLC